MPQVLILGVVGFTVDLQRNVVSLCIVDLFVTALDGPFSPRSDDCHIRSVCLDCQLETNLIVALAGCAVADGICALFQSDSCQFLTDDRTSERGTQQVAVLVNCASLYGGENVVLNEGLLQIQNDQLGSAGLDCLFFQTVQLCTLSYVCGNCDNFAVIVIFLQPRNDDRSIQTAGICQNNLFNILLCLSHECFLH